MNDLQLLIVTVILGGITYSIVKYLGKIFNKAAAANNNSSNSLESKKRKITPEAQGDYETAAGKDDAAEQKVVNIVIGPGFNNFIDFVKQVKVSTSIFPLSYTRTMQRVMHLKNLLLQEIHSSKIY